MSQTISVWVVLLSAVVAANLPFVNERLMAFWPLASGARKPLSMRFVELAILYAAVGGIGLAFERRLGQIAPQGWEFYAVTGALFVVLAFPGFAWRYLVKHRSAA